MIDLKNLINLLPYSYKSRDTYKVEGKGILERYLNIFGYYLHDLVLPDIDKTLESIDLNNTHEYNLNYFWEFLGQLPFGGYLTIDKDKWDDYYNGYDSKEEFQKKRVIWEIDKQGPIILEPDAIRTLLKYSITLIKIRGTKKYFETIFSIYGLKCNITDPINSTYKDSINGVTYEQEGDIKYPRFDEDYFDEEYYDISYKPCKQCIPISVDIGIEKFRGPFNDIDEVYFKDKFSIFIYGKRISTTNIMKGIEDYKSGQDTEDLHNLITLKEVLIKFFDNQLPFNTYLDKITFLETDITIK